MSEARVVGREAVLGAAPAVTGVSAAFSSAGEARLALADATVPLSAAGFVSASEMVARLIGTIAARVDVDEWVMSYGTTPDALALLADAREAYPSLDAALADADQDEAICLLALLASPKTSRERMLSPRARRLLLYATGRPFHLALFCDAEGVAHRLRVFQRQGGADVPFWLADRSLGVRFSFDARGVSFKAHHPLIQEALEARCAEDAIDLE